MNFTCSATIFGFIVAGGQLNTQPDAKIQIWRQMSQSSLYHKCSPNIPINTNAVCMYESNILNSQLRQCILDDAFRVLVQPGDILGLELPVTDMPDREIFFTNGGPLNYIFGGNLHSPVHLSDSKVQKQQLPQIIFNFTSGKNYLVAINTFSLCIL